MGETENILQTIKTTLQDFVAPDVRENKAQIEALRQELRIRLDALAAMQSARVDALETKQTSRFEALEAQFAALEARFLAFEAKQDARFAAVETKMDAKFAVVDAKLEAIHQRFDQMEARSEAQYRSILAAIAQNKAENETYILKQLASLSERVAALEATRH